MRAPARLNRKARKAELRRRPRQLDERSNSGGGLLLLLQPMPAHACNSATEEARSSYNLKPKGHRGSHVMLDPPLAYRMPVRRAKGKAPTRDCKGACVQDWLALPGASQQKWRGPGPCADCL